MPDGAIAPRCDPSAPFGTPVLVEGLVSNVDEQSARLSPDELTVVFSRRQTTDLLDLFVATRPSRDVGFGTPTVIGTANSVNSDRWPTLSPDGLVLLLDSDRGTGIFRMYQSRRASTSDPFGAAMAVAELAERDIQPYLANDRALYFSSAARTGGQGMSDIWRADIDPSGVIATPTLLIGGVNTAGEEEAPVLTPDERLIFYRHQGGIYTAQRSTPQDGFGTATPLAGLAEPGIVETPSWISPDGCALYLHKNGADGTNLDIFVATRP